MFHANGASPEAAARSRRGQALTIVLIVLALAGLVCAGELTHIHYKVNTDPNYKSNCNYMDEVNCEDVAASHFSEVLGVPISVWGLFAYATLLALAVAGTRRARGGTPAGLPGVTFLWSLAGLASGGALAYISGVVLQVVCPWCVGLYVVNLLVFATSYLLARRVAGGLGPALRADLQRFRRHPVITGVVAGGLAVAFAALLLFYPEVRMEIEEGAALPVPEGCGAGHHHAAEGSAHAGATEAVVTVEEFSDYECGHCRRAHRTLRVLVDEYKDRVRLVHHNFPLDNSCNTMLPRPFHLRACAASRAVICAEQQDEFWAYNDLLFANQQHLEKKHLIGYARNLKMDIPAFEDCLRAPETEDLLQRDIRDGRAWNIRGTPSFVINGRLVVGSKSPEQFRELIDEALKRCEEGEVPPTAPPPAPPAAEPTP